MTITVVLGPPCAGKSTYVAGKSNPGDVVIDYDVLAQAFGSPHPHDAPEAIRQVTFGARASAINQVIKGVDADAWIIHTTPKDEDLQRYRDAGAVITTIDPGKDVCLQRAAADDRPDRTLAAIEQWYAAHSKCRRYSGMLTKNQSQIALKAGPEDGLEEGQFTAYASVFGNVDSYGDVVVKGAFANDLQRWEKSGNPIPLLFGHNMSDPDYNIGHVVSAEEDEVGLKVTAQLDLENPKAKQTYRMLKGRRINQMSFAYDVLDSEDSKEHGDGVIALKDLRLYEVSVVAVGANQETEILAVKQAADLAERISANIKAGRVLSAKNESELRGAHEAIGRVLSVLDGTSDEQKASEPGPSRQVNDEETVEVKSEESPREATRVSSVNRSARIDALLGQIDAEAA